MVDDCVRVGVFPSTFAIRMVWLNGALGLLGGGTLITTILFVVVVTDITQESERYMAIRVRWSMIKVADRFIVLALQSSFTQERSSISVLLLANR